MTLAQAQQRAREQWGANVARVERYTPVGVRDGGWKGWRVVVNPGGVIHWMTQKGGPQCRCCRADTKRNPGKLGDARSAGRAETAKDAA